MPDPVSAYLEILWIALPVFLVIGIGFWLRIRGLLTREADRSLLALTIYVLTPCLIFKFVLGNPALKDSSNLLLPPLLGFSLVAAGIWIASLAGRRLLPPGEGKRASFSLSVGLFNYGFIPLPLAIALFDRETVGVLFLFNMGVEVCVWTLGVAILHGGGSLRQNWRQLLNPPLLAIVAGLLLNVSGGDAHVPRVLGTVFEMLGPCAIPLGLLLSGATIADFWRSFASKRDSASVVAAVALRMGLLPAGFLALLFILPRESWLGLTPELARVLVIQAAMPSAVFPIVMAKHYGADVPTALRVVVATSVIGLFTIPVWIHLGQWMIGRVF